MTIDILKTDTTIRNTISSTDLPFYISETIHLIEKYKKLLKTPKKISFMGCTSSSGDDREDVVRGDVIDEYIKIACEYYYIEPREVTKIKCVSCNVIIEKVEYEDMIVVCQDCSSEQGNNTLLSSFSDSSRIHVSSKYSYGRKTHFIECINQYQGKQNVIIPSELYDKLEEKIGFHDILIGDINTPTKERYSKVTKKSILSFLKELGYPKQYENINLIHSRITNTPLDDIDHIRELILIDFDKISDTYDKLYANISRKNFINTQYVLYQLLCRHGHPCDKNDFKGVKTMDRKFFHEDIIQTIFETIGWNYLSIL